MEDRRCKLGLAGRYQLIRLIEGGCSLRSAARESAVSPATAHRWWHRWQQAGEAERASLACLVVSPEEVVAFGEPGDRGLVAEGGVSAAMVVVPEPAVKGGGAFGA
jgi:hypothetical protein